MLKNQSVATIAAPEFLNIEPYNPLISQCEIKVLYVGENRNGSYITEDVARDMANSLPGTPIVAAFIENKDDFGDHGHVVTIEDGEIKFSCKTQPYGFVAPDAKIWFKEFVDTDEFGNEVSRKYLMTNGYLWTGQYPEIQKAIDEGLPQSMELDEASLNGHWATNAKSGVEFFIINDATFSKLCILGSDVEPCFEGAAVTEKQVSKNFTNNQDFVNTLFTMMNELKDALQYSEGGLSMENAALETPETVEEVEVEENNEFKAEDSHADNAVPQTSFVDDDNDDDDKDDEENNSQESDSKEDGATDDDDEGTKKKKPNQNHSLEELQEQFALVQAELETTKAELENLRQFKLGIENQQKDELIAKYHMLSDEVRKEISDHKSEYTTEEIESKLALAFVRENVDFSEVDGKKKEEAQEDPITTFSLDAAVDTTVVSPVLQALRDAKNN